MKYVSLAVKFLVAIYKQDDPYLLEMLLMQLHNLMRLKADIKKYIINS